MSANNRFSASMTGPRRHGSGPGITIGASLALKDTGRLAAGVLGDGDTLMSMNALWTAARYSIPVLFIVANNRSY
jgi:benzoylformate decarboxylase